MNRHYSQYMTARDKRAKVSRSKLQSLQGVVKTLRWTLGDINVEHPLS